MSETSQGGGGPCLLPVFSGSLIEEWTSHQTRLEAFLRIHSTPLHTPEAADYLLLSLRGYALLVYEKCLDYKKWDYYGGVRWLRAYFVNDTRKRLMQTLARKKIGTRGFRERGKTNEFVNDLIEELELLFCRADIHDRDEDKKQAFIQCFLEHPLALRQRMEICATYSAAVQIAIQWEATKIADEQLERRWRLNPPDRYASSSTLGRRSSEEDRVTRDEEEGEESPIANPHSNEEGSIVVRDDQRQGLDDHTPRHDETDNIVDRRQPKRPIRQPTPLIARVVNPSPPQSSTGRSEDHHSVTNDLDHDRRESSYTTSRDMPDSDSLTPNSIRQLDLPLARGKAEEESGPRVERSKFGSMTFGSPRMKSPTHQSQPNAQAGPFSPSTDPSLPHQESRLRYDSSFNRRSLESPSLELERTRIDNLAGIGVTPSSRTHLPFILDPSSSSSVMMERRISLPLPPLQQIHSTPQSMTQRMPESVGDGPSPQLDLSTPSRSIPANQYSVQRGVEPFPFNMFIQSVTEPLSSNRIIPDFENHRLTQPQVRDANETQRFSQVSTLNSTKRYSTFLGGKQVVREGKLVKKNLAGEQGPNQVEEEAALSLKKGKAKGKFRKSMSRIFGSRQRKSLDRPGNGGEEAGGADDFDWLRVEEVREEFENENRRSADLQFEDKIRGEGRPAKSRRGFGPGEFL